jgi:hypothetical protein
MRASQELKTLSLSTRIYAIAPQKCTVHGRKAGVTVIIDAFYKEICTGVMRAMGTQDLVSVARRPRSWKSRRIRR